MKILNKAPEDLWNSVIQQCPWATFFHTHTWAKIIQDTFPDHYKIATQAFGFDDETWIILPAMESGYELKGYFKSLESNVPGVYGGFISNRELTKNNVRQALKQLLGVNIKSVKIDGNPFCPNEDYLKAWTPQPRFTHVIDLDKLKTEEDLLASYNYSVRKQINKAVREGFRCTKATTLDEVREYYEHYQAALKRWGDTATNHYSFSLFENIFNAQSKDITLWLVKKDDKTVGGNLNFYTNRHALEWHCAYGEEYFKFGIRNFLIHEIIKDAKARNFGIYDFNPSGGHEGTMKFKESFGAVKRDFNIYTWQGNPAYKVFKSVKQHLFAR